MLSQEQKDRFINETSNKLASISGVNMFYFLDNNYQMIKSQISESSDSYLDSIISILKSEDLFNKLSNYFFSDAFHTYTILNESGLILITKLYNDENLYLVMIAGENTPVDLINLLRICKESRINYKSTIEANT